MVMLDSKNSRPGTVLERPPTEGYSKSDSQNSTASTNPNNSTGNCGNTNGTTNKNEPTTTNQNASVIDSHAVTAAAVHATEYNFDQSIRFGHGKERETLGDTLLHTDKLPLSSSTPHALATAGQGSAASTVAVHHLARYLKMSGVTEVGSESDSKIGKFMQKAGIDEYVGADKRERLLADLISGDKPDDLRNGVISPGSETVEQRDSGVKSESVNWRQLIPDVPSFGNSTDGQGSRSAGDTLERRSVGGESGQSQDEHVDREWSGAVPWSDHQQPEQSVQSSDNTSLPGGGLLRERTSYDLYNKETTNPPVTSQPEAFARTHKSSGGSSDTFLGGYEARDAVSLASGGSKELLQSAHTSDGEDKFAPLKAQSCSSSDGVNGSSSRSTVDSSDTGKQPRSTTYKDGRWGNKVSGMLEGISRRQNLSARVASILAAPPPKSKNEPVSRIPVKVTHGNQATPVTNPHEQQQSTAESLQTAPSNAQGSTHIIETPSAPVDEEKAVDTPRSDKSASEDEDVERVTQEYKAILKGVSCGLELNQEIDDLRSKIEEAQTPPKPPKCGASTLRGHVTEYVIHAEDIMDSGSETEDSLDRDVRRILTKYGRDVSSFTEDVPPEGRESPAGSAYETDDTLAHRVSNLLTRDVDKPTKPVVARDDQKNQLDGVDLESTGKSEETNTADLGSLKGRLSDALDGVAPTKPTSYSRDPLNERVRKILADTTHLESGDTTSKIISSNGSPTSSIDYHNLEKDLDEIQSHLESLKGDSSRPQSTVSEQSAELLKYVEGRVEDDTLRKARAVIGGNESDVSTSSSRLEPEGQGWNTPPARRLPLSPLLTSGVIPMDIALDMIHGSANASDVLYPNRSADTDSLLHEANVQYNRSFTRDVAGFAQEDALLNTGVSATDREVMEINRVQGSTADNSLTERVSRLVHDQSINRPQQSDLPENGTSRSERQAAVTTSGSELIQSRPQPPRDPSPGYDTSFNLSALSPLTQKPFTAFGNVHSLFANQLNKVSSTKFDSNLEASSPAKYHELNRDYGVDNNSRGIARAYGQDLHQGRSSDYGSLSPSSRARIDESRTLSPYGRDKSPVSDMISEKTGEPPGRRTSEDFRPPGSKAMYYVEVNAEGECNTSCTGYSETTIESTHPGSDDAVGPALPAHAYGSRKDAPKERVDAKDPSLLGTIQEQSLDETDAARHSNKSSKQSKTSSNQNAADLKRASSATPTESRYRYTEERERSFSKTKDWLNGNWPSKEDLASVSPERRTDRENRRSDGNRQSDSSGKSKEPSADGRSTNGSKKSISNRYSNEQAANSSKYASEHIPKSSNAEETSTARDAPRQYAQFDDAVRRAPSDVATTGITPPYEPEYSQPRPARVMYEQYSDKCQQLQSKYRNLKDRAEEAIHTLITGSAEPVRSHAPASTQRYDHKYGDQGAALEFGTPKRSGTSRLSLEMSLNGTGHKSLNDTSKRLTHDDTGMPSLNSTAKSDKQAGNLSTQEFLKYHTPAGTERPSGYRGPDYWSSKVKSNYDELTEVQSRLGYVQDRLSVSEDRLERVAYVAAARQNARMPAAVVDAFQPLRPDEDDVSMLRTKSPYDRPKSPYERAKLPYERAKSPYERAKSPYERAKSPYERPKSPYERANSPYERPKSPYERATSPYERAKSPYEITTSRYDDSKTRYPTHITSENYKYSDLQNQLRVDESGYHLTVEQMRQDQTTEPRSPRISQVTATRPSEIFLQSLDSGSRTSAPERGSEGHDVQELWERFDAMQRDTPTPTGSEGRPVNLDLEQLTSLLSNPAQHIIRNMQSGTVFDQREQSKSVSRASTTRSTPDSISPMLGGVSDKSRESLVNDVVTSTLPPRGTRHKPQETPVRIQTSAASLQNDNTDIKQDSGQTGQDGGGNNRDSGADRDRNGGSRGGDGMRRNNRRDDDKDDDDREKRRRRKAAKTNQVKETETEEDEMETQENDDRDDEDIAQRRMAWVIKDEELLSIPEDSTLESVSSDFTTSSEIDSDGKLVTKTTKRHLPNDPKLLKLQQKIAKQKEKYKRVQIMAHRRHNKIVHLEQLENKLEQEAAHELHQDSTRQHTTVDSLGTVTSQTTSTPSMTRQSNLESTLGGVSDISTTSTLTQGTVISEDLTYNDTMENTYGHDSDQSSVCRCCHKKRAKSADAPKDRVRKPQRSLRKASRSQSPPRSPHKRMAHTHPSPARRNKENIQEPACMKLREVDYSRLSISPNKTHALTESKTRSKTNIAMEIELPKAVPKTKKKSGSPVRREVRYADGDTKENAERKSARRSRRTQETELTTGRAQGTPKVKTRDFGTTCPTPMVTSPPVKRPVRHVTMVSEAIQTDCDLKSAQYQGKKSGHARSRDRRDRAPGIFTPECSENEDPAEQAQWHVHRNRTAQKQPRTVKAASTGVTWFVGMKEPKPWKQPLRERQANAVARETWPQMDEYSRRTLEDLMSRKTDSLGRVPSDYFPKHFPEDEEEEKKITGLQRAFDKRMQVFISKSRERQRLVKMRAEERSVNAVHGRDRDTLFRVHKKRMANVDAHPLSDLHFKPKKRYISKAEMREMAALKFKRLPEVQKACEDKKRKEFYKTNRMRAEIYNQKVLNRVLLKKRLS